MKLRLNLLLTDLAYRFQTHHKSASSCVQRWVDMIFYNLPASNISGPGLEKPWVDGKKNVTKMDVEEKLRKGLKMTFKILEENSLTDDQLLNEDKVGFTFIYKATYVCDYLIKINKASSSKSTPPAINFWSILFLTCKAFHWVYNLYVCLILLEGKNDVQSRRVE